MTPETLALKTCGLSVATPEPVRYGMRLNLESATGSGRAIPLVLVALLREVVFFFS